MFRMLQVVQRHGIGLNFRVAQVIMKLPLQEAHVERNRRNSFAAGSQGRRRLTSSRSDPAGRITFDRRELSQILNVYGRKVASGEWRDYAIDMMREKAVFSVFRRASETPLYRIEKAPKLARRQGAYSVVAATGLILKRGHDLARVLRALDKGLAPGRGLSCDQQARIKRRRCRV